MARTVSTLRRRRDRRAQLANLLSGDLDFHSDSSAYASHALHAFAAKFPPQIPQAFIEALTEPGDTVLDPMMGSGTAVLEAAMLGRRAIGVDLDPLALRICRAKTTPVNAPEALGAAHTVIAEAEMLLRDTGALQAEIERRYDPASRAFLDYWFLTETQHELMALVLAIDEVRSDTVRDLLRLIFSAIIITKSGGVSRAFDLAHTRPHRLLDKRPRRPVDEFSKRAVKAIAGLGELHFDPALIEIHQGDARRLPLGDACVDLIITSPPYANAIDYMRAHKFSLVWLGEGVDDLSRLRATYIGSENCGTLPEVALPPGVEDGIAAVAAKDTRKASILRKYLAEMTLAIREMARVLRPGGTTGVVVGPSTMRGVKVETHTLLAEIAASVGFEVVGVPARKLDRDRRMMPARHGHGTMNGIEQRMHEEFIIGMLKPQEARR